MTETGFALVALGLSEDGACDELFENLSLKEDLSNAIPLPTHLFSHWSIPLKVVYNEKMRGFSRWQLLVLNMGSSNRGLFGFNFVVVVSSTYFLFLQKNRQLLCDWHVNRQGAPNCSVRFPILSRKEMEMLRKRET
jgi:hypothetical protein